MILLFTYILIIYKIEFHFNEKFNFTAIDLKKGEVYRGEPKTKADTTLTVDDKDMIQMVSYKPILIINTKFYKS